MKPLQGYEGSSISLPLGEEDAVYFTDDEIFFDALNTKFNMARVGVSKVKQGVSSESLSHKWLISPEAAKRKLQHTTQRDIRAILHMLLLRQLKTNDQSLRYNRLQHNVFADTMQADTVSRSMN